jgi:putative endonuclease
MASHNVLGKEGEDKAAQWLLSKGYRLLHRNWRHSYYEIDIVAEKNNVLHFIEVKCRNHSPFGFPEDSVGKRKFKRLQCAADEYLHQHPGYVWIQYAILSITFYKDREPEFFLLEDVYL